MTILAAHVHSALRHIINALTNSKGFSSIHFQIALLPTYIIIFSWKFFFCIVCVFVDLLVHCVTHNDNFNNNINNNGDKKYSDLNTNPKKKVLLTM